MCCERDERWDWVLDSRLPVQRCKYIHTLQNSRAFCRPDSGYHQHRLLTRSKVKSWRRRAAQGKAPSTGVRGLGCSCTRYWQASVPISVRCRPTRPDGCCSSVPRDTHSCRKLLLPTPPPLPVGELGDSFPARKTSVAPNPWLFGSAAWRCGLQTLHAVVSETGSESGLGKRVPRDPATWAMENPPVVTVTAAVSDGRQNDIVAHCSLTSCRMPIPRRTRG
jgi:hypothetical protein